MRPASRPRSGLPVSYSNVINCHSRGKNSQRLSRAQAFVDFTVRRRLTQRPGGTGTAVSVGWLTPDLLNTGKRVCRLM